MISSLVQWFRRGAESERSGRGAGSARRFTPQLEALEDRAVPSAPSGWGSWDTAQSALLGDEVSGPSDVVLFRIGTGSKPGGAGDGVSSAALLGSEDDGPSQVILLGRKCSVSVGL